MICSITSKQISHQLGPQHVVDSRDQGHSQNDPRTCRTACDVVAFHGIEFMVFLCVFSSPCFWIIAFPYSNKAHQDFFHDFYGISMGFMTTWTSPNHHGSWISPRDFHHPAPSAQAGWRSVKALAGRRVRWMMVTCWETSTAKRIMMTRNIVLLVINVHILLLLINLTI